MTTLEKSAKKKRAASESGQTQSTVVVGVGASAGGLEVLRSILAQFGDDIGGCSLVVVQHMSPTSKSMLPELLSRETTIPVQEAHDGDPLLADQIYITPPNVDITIENRRIRLAALEERVGPKPSIDRFLISLAQEFGEHGIACILSGTGSDGTQGTRAIKTAGGIAIAQDPDTAKYDGMPRAAISTGVVDLVLGPEQIAREIANLARKGIEDRSALDLHTEEASKDILRLLHNKTKVNFALYKPNTIHRRLRRRMSAVKVGSLDDYYDYLKKRPSELDRLYQDVLISVTSFFRDREQFTNLENYLTSYIGKNKHKESIRIWSAGCATGEEPYSLAIAALEALQELRMSTADVRIQVFATDINEVAMNAARSGVFPAASVEGLPKRLVKRYFVNTEQGYRIKKEVRDLVLFARHDLTADPPFLKMDLISCRNLFIYFEPAVQERVLKIFHYALNLNGLLFLGKSESLGKDKSFFRVLDANAKIFERTNRLPAASMSFERLKYPTKNIDSKNLPPNRKSQPQLERELIRNFCPDSVVITDDFRVCAVYGKAGEYLRFPDGPMEQKLDGLLSPDLKNQIMTIVHRCRRSNQITRSGPILFRDGGNKSYVHATVYPTHSFEEPKFVVGFHTVEVDEEEHTGSNRSSSREVEELERELMATREHLQSVIEEQETSNEELQALNEELQSANEELQSSNEELETSNEELQSSNEELTTLNEELNAKNHELAEMSAHLCAVQNAIANPILVIDANLNMMDYNSKAEETFRLSSENLGRNFRLINSPFPLDPVFKTIEECLLHGRRQHTQFQSGGYDFDAYCLPIINETNNKVSGVVTTLVDNTTLLDTLRRADLAKRSMYRLMDGIPAKVSVRDADGRYTYVNPAFCSSVGMTESEILGATDVELFGDQIGSQRRNRDLEALEGARVTYSDETHPVDGAERVFQVARVPLWDDDGKITSVCSVGIDISNRAFMEKRLRELQTVIARAEDGFAFLQLRDNEFYVSFASQRLRDMCKLADGDLQSTQLRQVLACLNPRFSNQHLSELVESISKEKKFNLQFAAQHEGEKRYFDLRSFRIDETRIFMTVFDVTEVKTREMRLRKQQEDIEHSGKLAALGQMAAGIAHELKTPLSTIQGYVDLIRELETHTGSTTLPAIQDALDKIENTTTKMSDIIVGLKSIAKSDNNEQFETYDLNELVDDTLKMCVFRLRNKGIELQVDKPEKPLMVRAQPTQLSQVLINLVNNAVDAVQEYRDKWIRLEAKETADEFVVRVIDSGKGISKKVLSQVMTPFFTTKRDGTGLGLSLSQNIIKAHGGSLEVDQDCPNTCFQVRLPKSLD